MTEYTWREISCPTDVKGDDFARGAQTFRFQVGNPNAWIPNKSYFKIDMTLTEGDDKPVTVALAENAAACLYRNAELTVGGRPVSSATDLPQVQAAKTRLQTTYAWQQSCGKAVYGLESSPAARIADTATRNIVSRIWQPPIGIFDHGVPMGAGDYAIKLDPNTEFEKAAVECKQDLVIGTAAEDVAAAAIAADPAAVPPTPFVPEVVAKPAEYKLVINKVRFYICTVKMSIPSSVTPLLLRECEAHSKVVASDNTLEFTVPSSTDAITIFVQGGNAGSTNVLPPTKFACDDSSDRLLTSVQITYANVTKPPTRIGSQVGTDVNQIQQRYLTTHLESGMAETEGGAETLVDYLERGMMYHFSFNKDSTDKSTQVQVSVTIPGIQENANLFLLAHYTRMSDITTNNGHTVDVKSYNI